MTLGTLNLGCGEDTWGTDRIDKYKTPATTKVWDVAKKSLPYKNETFGVIKAHSVLEHFKNPGFVADECYRVLKKGGKLFVRVDYAGYLPMYLFKSHEHNAILDKQYGGKAYGHEQEEDRHYFLFVESHLDALFSKFRERKYRYISVGRNKFVNLLLRILPFHLGAIHIEMEAVK